MELEKVTERMHELNLPGNILGSILFPSIRRMDLWLIFSVRQKRTGNRKQCGHWGHRWNNTDTRYIPCFIGFRQRLFTDCFL